MTNTGWTTIGFLLRETGGSIKTGPFGTILKASEYSQQGVPVISVGEVGYGSLRIADSTRRVGPDVVRRLPEYVLRAGDIVFGRKGAVDRSAHIRESEDGYFLGSDGIRVRFGAAADPRFIVYQLQSAQAREWLVQNAVGTTMPSLNQAVLERLPIRVPSIEEQHSVAQVLGEADALIVSLECSIAKKQAIKQGVMQQLLTGRTRLHGFQGAWTDRLLGDLLQRPPRYGVNAAAVESAVGVYTYIRITDIDDYGYFTPCPKVGVRHPNAADYRLQAGEIVFARTGASVGKSYLYDPRDGDLVYAGFLINVKPDPVVLDARYLSLCAHTAQYWSWVARTSVRSGQPGINGREYSQLELFLPEVQEQRAIADVLVDAEHEIDVLRGRLDKAHDMKQGMMQQLLTGRTRLPVQEGTV
jgi:type I restriction enzyme, S subunit